MLDPDRGARPLGGGGFYRLAPGVEVVEVDDDRFTLRSEFDAFQLSGAAAAHFARVVLAQLDAPTALDDIVARLPGYSAGSVAAQLDLLVERGLVSEVDGAQAPPPDSFTAFLSAVGQDPAELAGTLASLTVAVFGLETHGALLAEQLVRAGFGEVRVVDPRAGGRPHGTLDADADADAIRGVLDGCDLAFGCWDLRDAAAMHRLNRVALDLSVPVLYSELRATSTLAGPLVLPGRSACWMCYRMRLVAAAPDFTEAMAFEEHLDHVRRPAPAPRPSLPPLAQHLASMLAVEALRIALNLHPPVHVDTVVEYDALTGDVANRPVLAVPECPVCSKKAPRHQPPIDELVTPGPRSDLLGVADRLTDPRTGVVIELAAVAREPTESPMPHIWRARVANHRFLPEHDAERAGCSGKGMTVDEARTSCLGEAVERYSGACWSDDELTVSRRSALDGPSLDPRALVLFDDEQYGELPYSPYRDEAELTWFGCRSLVSGDLVQVPASAVVMDYPVRSPDEFLFPITSNGLAAGPTLPDAVLAAVCEVLERDALLVAWYNRLPGKPYDPSTHPDADVRTLAALWERRGVVLELVRLPTDHPVAVFMAILRPQDPAQVPAAVVGLGAEIDPLGAARKAALEVGQVRPSLARYARGPGATRAAELLADPASVTTLEEHALLYSRPEMAEAFDFLRGAPGEWPAPRTVTTADALRSIVAALAADGGDVLYANLTPPDMAALGLHTARAVVPELQPISFGRGERRLGGRRLYELPVRLGLRSRPATAAELNPLPHPIA